MFYPIFTGGYMVYLDNPVHHYETEFLAKQLLPVHRWINGWSMQAFLGYPILLYQPQLGNWLTIILSKIFSLSLLTCYKISVLFSLALLGCGMYTIVAYRFGKAAGLCTSFLLMLQKDVYYDKILAGMWNNYLAIGILLIFLTLLYKYANCLTLKKAILLGMLFSVIILSHLFAAIFAFFLIFVVFLINKPTQATPEQKWTAQQSFFFLIPIVYGWHRVYSRQAILPGGHQ